MAKKKVNSNKVEKPKELTEKQKRFCSEYIFDFNATRAYKSAYPDCKSDGAARVSANRLLTNTNIQTRIAHIERDIAKEVGISKGMILKEHKKIAFSSIAMMHNTWIDRKEMETLTDDQKACISEIDTRVLKRNIGTSEEPDIIDVEQIKIKLYDKQKSLVELSKMLGLNEPEKIDHTITEQVVVFELPDNGRNKKD